MSTFYLNLDFFLENATFSKYFSLMLTIDMIPVPSTANNSVKRNTIDNYEK